MADRVLIGSEQIGITETFVDAGIEEDATLTVVTEDRSECVQRWCDGATGPESLADLVAQRDALVEQMSAMEMAEAEAAAEVAFARRCETLRDWEQLGPDGRMECHV